MPQPCDIVVYLTISLILYFYLHKHNNKYFNWLVVKEVGGKEIVQINSHENDPGTLKNTKLITPNF